MTTEFDRVFDQMEAPEHPATCDNCGEVGTNATMEQHECSTEQPRPEQGSGERNDKMYSKSSRQTKQHIHTCMFCGQSGAELSNTPPSSRSGSGCWWRCEMSASDCTESSYTHQRARRTLTTLPVTYAASVMKFYQCSPPSSRKGHGSARIDRLRIQRCSP